MLQLDIASTRGDVAPSGLTPQANNRHNAGSRIPLLRIVMSSPQPRKGNARCHGACATFGTWEGSGLHPSPLSLAGIRLIGLILAIGHSYQTRYLGIALPIIPSKLSIIRGGILAHVSEGVLPTAFPRAKLLIAVSRCVQVTFLSSLNGWLERTDYSVGSI